MPDRTPSLCIGLPVRNGEAFLAEALESVVGQTYGDFELIISDNASTDATRQICQAYVDRDRRIRYTRNDRNIGAAPNFNKLVKFCNAPFFKWMTHDDMLAPTYLERCMAMLAEDPGVVLAHTGVRMVDADGVPLTIRADGKVLDRHGRPMLDLEPMHLAESTRPEQRFDDALRRMTWCLYGLGVLRTEALRRTHLQGSYYGGDYVLLAELALLGRFRQWDEPLYYKRCHGGISVHLNTRERARMIDPNRSALPGVKLRLGYLGALRVTRLSLRQRLACMITVARVSIRNKLLYRILPHGLRSLPLVGGLFGRV